MKKLQIFVYIVCITIVLQGGITPELQTQAKILSDFVVFAWTLGFINLVYLRGTLNQFGVCPRTTIELFGIVLAPFLHGSWTHLMGNTIPFIILGWFVLLRGITDFYIVTLVSILVGGLGTWMFGREYTSHIGASGIIFGYLGFLLLYSYVESDSLSIILSTIVGFLYGRTLWGIFPLYEGVSWEGHLFGLLGGVLAAGYMDILKPMFSFLSQLLS